MAHIDLGYDLVASLRPAAPSGSFRARAKEHTQRPAPARPKFCRINGGQLARAAFLVLLCLGLSQLSHAEKFSVNGAVGASQSKF